MLLISTFYFIFMSITSMNYRNLKQKLKWKFEIELQLHHKLAMFKLHE